MPRRNYITTRFYRRVAPDYRVCVCIVLWRPSHKRSGDRGPGAKSVGSSGFSEQFYYCCPRVKITFLPYIEQRSGKHFGGDDNCGTRYLKFVRIRLLLNYEYLNRLFRVLFGKHTFSLRYRVFLKRSRRSVTAFPAGWPNDVDFEIFLSIFKT